MEVGDDVKKIAMICPTYNRPKELGRLIECFNRQTYENRELVILDDGGQYPSQPSGDRWRVVSVPKRFPSLCAKRNACAALTKADYLQVADDDDLYLPWALAAMAKALDAHEWVQPREAFEFDGKVITRTKTDTPYLPSYCAHHGNWGYRRSAFVEIGGYPPGCDDDAIAIKFRRRFGAPGDTLCDEFPDPAYIYSREQHVRHISPLFWKMSKEEAWAVLGQSLPVADLKVGFDRDYFAMPRPAVAKRRAW